jgi:Na+/H+ antiporter NhaD/arsenite permease-like protein
MTALIILVFVLGYLAIALEHQIHINKAASALVLGVLCWTLYAIDVDQLLPMSKVPTWFAEHAQHEGVENVPQHYMLDGQLLHLTGELAGILFFLMGAMTIVELVDAHEGFQVVTSRIKATSYGTLLWIVAWLTFFMSSVLDNLTTTIVMISVLRKLIPDREKRLMFAGVVVIAANAGGAWTVIGDVTTTMMWMARKIGTIEVMYQLILPSIICLLVPLVVLGRLLGGAIPQASSQEQNHIPKDIQPWHQYLFLILGVMGLLSVPIFKAYTHLPPFMGMMLSLGVMWVISEFVGHTLNPDTRSTTGVLAVLQRVDMSSILFFLGILLAVGALSATGILQATAQGLDQVTGGRHEIVALMIGLLSAVVDNVPLVAAGLQMYEMKINDPFWMSLAYCAGTGGSCLIIGSAAGVAAMGLEKISFIWYLRKVAPWALLGYLAGYFAYLGQAMIFG